MLSKQRLNQQGRLHEGDVIRRCDSLWFFFQTSVSHWEFCEVFWFRVDSIWRHRWLTATRGSSWSNKSKRPAGFAQWAKCECSKFGMTTQARPNYAALSLLLCQSTTLWWNMLSTVMHMQHVALCGRVLCTWEQQAKSPGFHHHHLEQPTCRPHELCRYNWSVPITLEQMWWELVITKC